MLRSPRARVLFLPAKHSSLKSCRRVAGTAAMSFTIYHNPKCSTSRNVLGFLRDAGHEPRVIEYLKTPPSKTELKKLIKRMGAKVADVVRWKEPIVADLGLEKDSSDEELLDAMMQH